MRAYTLSLLLTSLASAARKTSIVILAAEDMDPEMARQLAVNYTKEMFSPLKPPILRNQPVVFALDKDSPLHLSHPNLLSKFAPGVKVMDVAAEISSGSDMFKALHLHMIEENRKGNATTTITVDRLKSMLYNVFTVPRSYAADDEFRKGAGDFISKQFGLLGLLTGFQMFKPTQFHRKFYSGDPNQLPTGSNIIGIFPGRRWGTPRDKVVILGAHWDTLSTTDGFNDNGSGLAALLEVATVLTGSSCEFENSIMFVAFDLEEMGMQGSLEFMHRFLIPDVLLRFGQTEIGGAFILDTLLNRNRSLGSQDVTEGMRSLFAAEYVAAVADNGYRGDFVQVVNRKDSADRRLLEVLKRNWGDNEEGIRLLNTDLDLRAKPTEEELVGALDFLRSDHSRFWETGDDGAFQSFPAVLLTDTGPYRGAMRECYHASCDSVRGENSGDFADFEFYAHTVRALTRAVSDLAEEEEGGRLCHFEVSVARGTFCDPTGRLLVTACVLSWWFYAFSDHRGQ